MLIYFSLMLDKIRGMIDSVSWRKREKNLVGEDLDISEALV
jgi:hypothetical protein